METETLSSCNICKGEMLEVVDPIAELWRCQKCGYVFVNPQPTLPEVTAYYSKPAKYDVWLSEEHARDRLWQRRVRKVRRHMKPGSLLDIGSGIGEFLFQAKGTFSEVFGTEISESAIAIAKEKYGLDLIRGDIETISFGRTFDNITLFHVLEHVPDPGALLAKCWSLLNEGGVVFIAMPNDLLSMERRFRTVFHGLSNVGSSGRRLGASGLPKIALDGTVAEIHLSQFTPKTLRQTLERFGFTIVSDSLDPYYAKTGRKLILHCGYYLLHWILKSVLNINRYNTIWMAARKAALHS
jgi:SAM-dependent methyltransferase